METKKKNFENDIESYLLSHGYMKESDNGYHRAINMC